MSVMPPPGEAPAPMPSPDAANRLNAPALGLMIAAGIGMLFQVLSLLMNLLGVGMGAASVGHEGMMNLLSGGVGMLINVVGMAIGGLIIFGAMKMKQLQNYNLALAAAVIAMIPCLSPCCLLGLPIGIWALVILIKPEVKSAFTS